MAALETELSKSKAIIEEQANYYQTLKNQNTQLQMFKKNITAMVERDGIVSTSFLETHMGDHASSIGMKKEPSQQKLSTPAPSQAPPNLKGITTLKN